MNDQPSATEPEAIPVKPITDEDYEKRYTKIRKRIDLESVDPTKYIIQLEGVIKQIMQGNSTTLSESHVNYFLTNALDKIVLNLTNRRFKDREDLFLRANDFLLLVIDFAIHIMHQDKLGVLEAVDIIFDDTRNIYKPRDREDVLFVQLKSRDPKEKVEHVVSHKGVSQILLYNINYFVSQGGMDVMLERIQKEDNKIPVPALRLYTTIWSRVCEFLIRAVKKELIAVFQPTVFSLMLGLNDNELRPVKKDDVGEIVRRMSEILSDYSYTSNVHELCEKFSLEFALKCFRSSNLEKRMQGLSYIEEAREMTRRRAWGLSSTSSSTYRHGTAVVSKSYYPVAKWMTTGWLLEWINANQIVESLYDLKSDPHRELIKRSKGLLRFLAAENSLTKQRLALVWNVLEADHSTDAVYEVLNYICASMEEKLQLFLFEKIVSLPYAKYTPATITLIPEFNKIKDKMVELLWNIMQDDSGASNEIADKALEELLHKLKEYSMRYQLPWLLNACVASIQNRRSVLQAVTIMHKVIGNTMHFIDEAKDKTWKTWPSKKDEYTRQSLLEELEKKHGLVGLLFEEIKDYKAMSDARLPELANLGAASPSPTAASPSLSREPAPSSPSPAPSSSSSSSSAATTTPATVVAPNPLAASAPPAFDPSKAVLLGRYPHLKNIRARLDFLEFVLANSSAKMTRDSVDALWDAFLTPSGAVSLASSSSSASSSEAPVVPSAPVDIATGEKAVQRVCLRWFYDICLDFNRSEAKILDKDVALHIYGRLEELCLSNTAALTDVGFDCYARYMCCVNVHAGNFKMASLRKTTDFTVICADFNALLGVECMWKIVFEAKVPVVAKDAMELLVKLYQNVDRKKLDINAIQKAYVDKCMGLLRECQTRISLKDAGDDTSAEESQMDRLISILRTFLDEAKKREDKRIEEQKKKEEEQRKKEEEKKKEEEEQERLKEEEAKLRAEGVLPANRPPTPPPQEKKPKKRLPQQLDMDKPNIMALKEMFLINEAVAVLALSKNGWSLDRACGYLCDEVNKERLLKEAREYEGGDDSLDGADAPASPAASSIASAATATTAADAAAADANNPAAMEIDADESTNKDKEKEKDKEDGNDDDDEHANKDKEKVSPMDVEEISPSLFLSNNQEYFDQLFDLLNVANIDKSKVWDILCQLPTNQRILETFKTLKGDSSLNKSDNKPNWDELLNPNFLYKMLYSLKIINTLMTPSSDANEEEIVEKEMWCRKFFYAYGFHHLFKMLASNNQFHRQQDKNSGVYKSCLKYLLKIVHYLIKGGLKEKSFANIPSTPFGIEVGHGSRSIHAASNNSANSDNNGKQARRELAFSATTGKKLIDSVDFPIFVRTMIDITWTVCKGYPPHPDDVQVIKYALSLLVASIASRPDLLANFYNYPHSADSPDGGKEIEEFIIGVVMNHHDSRIRQATANGLYQLAYELRNVPEDQLPKPKGTTYTPSVYLLELLLAHMPPEDSPNVTCEQYFKFLNHLIREYCEESADRQQALKRFDDLLWTVLQRIKRRETKETSRFDVPDHVLIGLMSLLSTLLHQQPSLKRRIGAKDGENLIAILWHKFLFPPPVKLTKSKQMTPSANHNNNNNDDDDDEVIEWKENSVCKTPKSRAMALKLLAELANGCEENFEHILGLIFDLHEEDIGKPRELSHPAEKNVSGYVGLRNPGCICYMNSFLQQLFMNPTLRYGILTAKIKDEENIDENRNKQNVHNADSVDTKGKQSADDSNSKQAVARRVRLEENMLYQLQRMFGHLLHSEKQYYDPADTFCKAFKSPTGEPVNLFMQEDASEFVYNLFARLENLLKGTEHEKLIQNFTGKESQIVRCSDNPEHFSESEHDISLITVGVKGKPTLQEALEAYVEGDKLDDWKCADCNKVVGALKRSCYKTLSNTLIIHLKRFDYTIDAMGDIKQYKILDSFEFPLELDMEPYTTEGIAKKEAIEREKKKRGIPEDEEWNPEDIEMPQIHPKSYYLYELVGILVHSGTQDAGHYYSFIKERTKGKNAWFEFNDTLVRPFDIKRRLRAECFGGEKEARSAYILFYQRCAPEPESFVVPDSLQQALIQNSQKSAEERKHSKKYADAEKEAEKERLAEREREKRLAAAAGSSSSSSSTIIDDFDWDWDDWDDDGTVITSVGNSSKRARVDAPVLIGPQRPPPGELASSDDYVSTSTGVPPPPPPPPPPGEFYGSNSNLSDAGSSSSSSAMDTEPDPLRPLFSQVIPDDVLEDVWTENFEVTRHRHMFGHEYMEFLCDIFALVSLPEPVIECDENNYTLRILRMATYFMDTLVRCGREEEKLYKSFMVHLQSLYAQHVPACRWLLSVLVEEPLKSRWLRYHLLDCTYKYVRQGFAQLVVTALTVVSPLERELLAQEMIERRKEMPTEEEESRKEPEMGKEFVYTHQSATVTVRFVEYMLSIMESTRRAWRRFHEYFAILRDYSALGFQERMFLADRGFVGMLVDYYMGPFSPYLKKNTHRVTIGDPPRESAELEEFMEAMMNVVKATACSGYLATGRRPETAWPDDPELARMGLKDRRLMFNREYFSSLLKQMYHLGTNVALCAHFSWEDEERTVWLLELILKAVASDDNAPKILPVLDRMLRLRDSIRQWRVTLALNPKGNGLLYQFDRSNANAPVFGLLCAEFVLKQFEENPTTAAYLYKTRDLWWSDMERFLLKDRNFKSPLWRSVENPRERLLRCFERLSDVWKRIDSGRFVSAAEKADADLMMNLAEEDDAAAMMVVVAGGGSEDGAEAAGGSAPADDRVVLEWDDELDKREYKVDKIVLGTKV